MTSTEWQRQLSPTLAEIPDARVSFESQNGGGPDPDSRDIHDLSSAATIRCN